MKCSFEMNKSKVGRHVTLEAPEGRKWSSMHTAPRIFFGKGTFEGGLIGNY